MATKVGSGPPVSVRPTGTVTFLFSDIEGSTVRWERDRDAMAAALARHDALMRESLEARGGYVFKTVGDAFCAAFAGAQEALAGALDAQHALLAEDFSAVDGIRVRMALHSGSAEERDGDYFGPAVNRVARLLAIGHGGQVLVSGICSELLQDGILPPCSLRDLGAHRLKDLAQPEHVHQLIAPDLPEAFPPLLSLDYLSNNLPAQLTSFVGREDVVVEIKALLEQHRLVTLVGTGGAGKTRCAIQVGAELLDGSGNGVWLAELAPISDPSLVVSVVARTVGVLESPNRPLLDTLLAHLKHKRLLLVLDNCEHVIQEARSAAATILHGCHDVRILATSRESLNIAGEQLYPMPSLSVPPAGQTLSAKDVLTFGAPLLFADRAFRADSHFALTEENASYVAEICRRLDGIPLAIELAAARVRVLELSQLSRKLDERFRLLTGGSHDVLPRQQTMRAAIDWSHNLLTEPERLLFRRVGIFAGGWTLETAEAVCVDATLDPFEILDLHGSLVEKSLVVAELAENARYRLLESTRAYAVEKLEESGERAVLAQRHAAWMADFAAQMFEASSGGLPIDRWLAVAGNELENARAALTWSLGTGADPIIAARIARDLSGLWSHGGRLGEGRRWIEATISALPDGVAPAIEGPLWHILAGLGIAKQTVEAAERAIPLFEQAGDRIRLADAHRLRASGLWQMQRFAEAEAAIDRALELMQQLDQTTTRSYAGALGTRATILRLQGRTDEGRALYRQAIALYTAIGEESAAAIPAVNLAELEFEAGDARRALELATEAAATFARLGMIARQAKALTNAAGYQLALGESDAARTAAREALALGRRAQDTQAVSIVLVHLAAVAALRGDSIRAATLLGYVEAWCCSVGYELEFTERHSHGLVLSALRERLSEDELAALTRQGALLDVERIAAEALQIS
jgi:predicted ATPase/class 3 adenylate cyclase